MERKTKVQAEDGKHDLFITREFELPVELLFKAYTEADIVEQWMGTKVLKMESKKQGGYRIQTSDNKGNVAFEATGVIHELIPNQKITKTFEMEHTPFGVQLEVHDFESLGPYNSKLTVHVIYETVGQRDEVLKLPFAQGINMAHNRLENAMKQIK